MTTAGHQSADERSEPREPVLHRTRLTGPDGAERTVTLVNVSPSGFMARCDHNWSEGEQVTLALPRLGKVAAEIRWSLGGRIGCRLRRPLGLADYHALLQALPRG
jgi:hypothetical protein